MDHRSTQKLKLDRRLIRRRGWISQEELERELAALPDVSAKIAELEPQEADSAADRDADPE
jgi:hypothetical protein